MSNLENEKKQIEKQLTFLVPDVTDPVPEEVKSTCITFVGERLPKHPNTMLQFTPDQILESINSGRAIIALEDQEVVGFGQLWQYGFNQDGQQILEFGSWLSIRSGCGARILREAISLGKRIDPTAQLIAITEKENLRVQDVLREAGAKELYSKPSPVIRTVEGEAALMKVFDITSCI